MDLLNCDSLVEALNKKILSMEVERNHAAENDSYQKAAQLDNELNGFRKAVQIVQMGDHHVNTAKD